MFSRFLSGVVPIASLFISGVWAQSEMAQCPAGWDWNRNSFDQDPCTIGSMMDAACRSLSVYTYPPLNSSQYYLPPRVNHSGDLSCDCNTVMYSLYMACASCQGAETYSWTTWIRVCESVYVSQYPFDIPQSTSVPYWAYYNVTTAPDQTYNDTTAMHIGQNPEEMPPLLTVTVTISSTNTGTSTSGHADPTSGSTNDDNGSNGRTNVGTIVGGVVGSVVPLTILAAAVFFYVRHRRRRQAQQQRIQSTDGLDLYEQRAPLMHGHPTTPVPLTLYNPSDPTTFPPQIPQRTVAYTTPSHDTRRTYYGLPEV